jgi:hypothetical protein
MYGKKTKGTKRKASEKGESSTEKKSKTSSKKSEKDDVPVKPSKRAQELAKLEKRVIKSVEDKLGEILVDVPSFKGGFENIELMWDREWWYDDNELLFGDWKDPDSICNDEDCYALYVGTVFSIVSARRVGRGQTLRATYILSNRLRQKERPKGVDDDWIDV